MELKHTEDAQLGKVLWSDGDRLLIWAKHAYHRCWIIELVLSASSNGLISVTVLTLEGGQDCLTELQIEATLETLEAI